MQQAIGFIGGGQMAEAIIAGLVQKQMAVERAIYVYDPLPARQKLLKEKYGVNLCESNQDVLHQAQVVIIAVKPQVLRQVLSPLASHLRQGTLIISLAAGVTIEVLESLFPQGTAIIRTVPNMPALIGQGITVLSANSQATDKDLEVAREIFGTLGQVLVLEESYLNAVTGLSGSGPAYVYLFLEALIDGGVQGGLPRDVARKLAVQTVIGAAKMVEETGKHPAVLKDMVTSPGGTTMAGLYALERGNLRATVMEAVLKAQQRAQELSEK